MWKPKKNMFSWLQHGVSVHWTVFLLTITCIQQRTCDIVDLSGVPTLHYTILESLYYSHRFYFLSETRIFNYFMYVPFSFYWRKKLNALTRTEKRTEVSEHITLKISQRITDANCPVEQFTQNNDLGRFKELHPANLTGCLTMWKHKSCLHGYSWFSSCQSPVFNRDHVLL